MMTRIYLLIASTGWLFTLGPLYAATTVPTIPTMAATTTLIPTTQTTSTVVSLTMIAFAIPILLWIAAVICCYPLVCLFYRFCLRVRLERSCGWKLGCCTCTRISDTEEPASEPDNDTLELDPQIPENTPSHAGAPPQYDEALFMDKPKPGDVVRFRNDVDGTLCTFTFSERDKLGDPPIYNFTNDDQTTSEPISDDRPSNTEGATITQIIDVHNSTITVNVNTDAGLPSTITVNTAGNKSTITVNATSVAVEITPELRVDVVDTAIVEN